MKRFVVVIDINMFDPSTNKNLNETSTRIETDDIIEAINIVELVRGSLVRGRDYTVWFQDRETMFSKVISNSLDFSELCDMY